MPAGGLVVAGAAAALPYIMKMGQTPYSAQNFGQSNQYNPYASNTGIGTNYGALGAQAGTRGPIQAQTGQVNAAQMLGSTSRDQQEQALNLMRLRAMGQVPSIAELQARQQMQNATQQQASMVASTRGGPGAQALAARAGMYAGAQMRGQVAGQAATAAAQERLAAEQAYMQGASGIRGQDLSLQGLNQQFALGQGQLALGSQGQNDQLQLGMYGLQNQLGLGEAGLRVQQQGQLAGSQSSANAINAGNAQFNANAQNQNFNTALGGAMGAAQMGMVYGAGGPPPAPAYAYGSSSGGDYGYNLGGGGGYGGSGVSNGAGGYGQMLGQGPY